MDRDEICTRALEDCRDGIGTACVYYMLTCASRRVADVAAEKQQ